MRKGGTDFCYGRRERENKNKRTEINRLMMMRLGKKSTNDL